MLCCRPKRKKTAIKEDEVIKILLLGIGGAGKTTIIKQMKILHIDGFSEEDKRERIPFIKNNVHESIYDLLRHMPLLTPPIHFASESNKNSAEIILSLGEIVPTDNFNDEYFNRVSVLWNDPGVQECYSRSNEFYLVDCAKYFLNNIDRIRQDNYLPTQQDILHCRSKTTAINKIEFSIKVSKKMGGGSRAFWMYDVGGQRGEKRKWIHIFADVNTVVFLIACNEFDQSLPEDPQKNRLRESIELFQSLWTNILLREVGFIVFLNKQDLLKDKILNGKSILNYFPEYNNFQITGTREDSSDEYQRTRLFILKKLVDITEKRVTTTSVILAGQLISEQTNKIQRQCYYHFTTATDSNNIKYVFENIHSMLIIKNLSENNLL